MRPSVELVAAPKALAQPEQRLEPALGAVGRRPVEDVDRALVVRHGLIPGRGHHRRRTGSDARLRGQKRITDKDSFAEMKGDGVDVARIERGDRLPDRPVQAKATVRRHPCGQRLADQVVTEPVSADRPGHLVQHVRSDGFVQCVVQLLTDRTLRRLDHGGTEVAPDHRGGGERLVRGRRQA